MELQLINVNDMIIPKYTTGDDLEIPVTIKKDGNPVSIDTGATIKAAFVSKDGRELISPVVTCSSTATGADWPNGIVIVSMGSSDSSKIKVPKNGLAQLEVEIDDNVNSTGKLTRKGYVIIEKGNV